MMSNCDLKFGWSATYHREGFRIPRADKNSGKSNKTGKFKYGQCIGKPKYLIPQYLGFVTLDTPFLPAGADMSEHTLVAYLNKR